MTDHSSNIMRSECRKLHSKELTWRMHCNSMVEGRFQHAWASSSPLATLSHELQKNQRCNQERTPTCQSTPNLHMHSEKDCNPFRLPQTRKTTRWSPRGTGRGASRSHTHLKGSVGVQHHRWTHCKRVKVGRRCDMRPYVRNAQEAMDHCDAIKRARKASG